MGLLRTPVRSKPEEISSFEKYALVDALEFFKQGLRFPYSAGPITYLQYLFLLEGYKNYYEDKLGSIQSNAFEQGMNELGSVG